MYDYDAALVEGKPAAGAISAHLRQQLQAFVTPLLQQLDALIDARLVRTFAATLEVLVRFRHRQQGLLLSELGAFLLSPAQAPAGTKRLSNLLRCGKWQADLISTFLWKQAQQRVSSLQSQGEDALVLWDESVVEKPESRKAEGLGAVRSSKGRRLTRPKPGCFRRPGPPIVVPGLQWLALLVLGPSGPPTVAAMRWFKYPKRDPKVEAASSETDAENASPEAPSQPSAPWFARLRELQEELLLQCIRSLGRRVVHVWDRGAAGEPWLKVLWRERARFVMRWPRGYQLVDAAGLTRPAWQIARGKRVWGSRGWWDARERQYRRVGVLAFRVSHPAQTTDDPPLWLVVARTRGRSEPWYLITSETIHTEADAWRVVRAYARRWQIELAFRYGKSELAMESPRLWRWENRVKLLLMVTVVYAFLLSLLDRALLDLRTWLLRYFCHRTGHRARAAKAPLYRLREALSHLWSEFPARFQTPG